MRDQESVRILRTAGLYVWNARGFISVTDFMRITFPIMVAEHA